MFQSLASIVSTQKSVWLMFQPDTCGVIIMPKKTGSYVTKCAWRCWQLGQYIAFVECYFTSSVFVSRACFALSVSGALIDRQVQALLAPNYRWLDPQQRSKKNRFWNAVECDRLRSRSESSLSPFNGHGFAPNNTSCRISRRFLRELYPS